MTATESVTAPSVKRSRNLLPNRSSEAWRRRLPLLPALLFTIVLTQVPFVMSIWYSLTDWKVVPPGQAEFVGIPEFQDVGTQCTQQFSAVIAKRTSIDAALDACQQIASRVGQ